MLQHRVLAWFFAFTAMQILTAVFFAIKEFVALYHITFALHSYIASTAAMHVDRGHVLFLIFFIGGHTCGKREETWSAFFWDNFLPEFLWMQFVTQIFWDNLLPVFLWGQFVT